MSYTFLNLFTFVVSLPIGLVALLALVITSSFVFLNLLRGLSSQTHHFEMPLPSRKQPLSYSSCHSSFPRRFPSIALSSLVSFPSQDSYFSLCPICLASNHITFILLSRPVIDVTYGMIEPREYTCLTGFTGAI